MYRTTALERLRSPTITLGRFTISSPQRWPDLHDIYLGHDWSWAESMSGSLAMDPVYYEIADDLRSFTEITY